MAKKLTKQEALEILKDDNYLRQIVFTTKQLYPKSRIYTTKFGKDAALVVYISDLTREQCTEIGRMISSDYSYEIAGEDFEYPFFIEKVFQKSVDHLLDVTDLYRGV